jgi:non-homologous end joining protein Ku
LAEIDQHRPAPPQADEMAYFETDANTQLIDAASGPVDWPAYPDQTAEELRALVEAKVQDQAPRPAKLQAVVLPLLEALQQSIADLEPAEKTGPRPKERLPRQRGKRTA